MGFYGARAVARCRAWRRGWPSVRAAPIAQDTIKVGILHSLSGTMAISETSLKDVR